ncbi:phosphoribosyltransferase [Demequina sp. NBRC 110056]|uniref:phosphoribosyltransferase n=1 Tax=Demequina sp. NBRC 110056 TaxID=1570345 RepID=UPI001F383343|nr:phosphoribosyltransferase family protein [Demequina sp. NBRC 110056]
MSLDWAAVRATVEGLGVDVAEVLLAGSAPLVAVGAIDAAGDVDLVARGGAWDALARRGQVRSGELGDLVVDLPGGVQAFSGWHGTPASEVFARARRIDGLLVLSLPDLIAYKRRLGRDKDREHLGALARWSSEMTDATVAAAAHQSAAHDAGLHGSGLHSSGAHSSGVHSSGAPVHGRADAAAVPDTAAHRAALPRLRDRRHAGELLAARLGAMDLGSPLVLALPRGGVPVAASVARALEADLDVLVVRKLGVPANPEYAFGAIGERGVAVVDPRIVAAAGLTQDEVDAVEHTERAELDRRSRAYRPGRDELDLTGRTAVIVDDGSATGATARAAVAVARRLGAERIVAAVGACPPDILALIGREADVAVAALTAEPFAAVGQWYDDFAQTSDDEVRDLLGLG